MTLPAEPVQTELLDAILKLTPEIQQLILLISDAQLVPEGAAERIDKLIGTLMQIGEALSMTSDQMGEVLDLRLPAIEKRMAAFETVQQAQNTVLQDILEKLTQLQDWFGAID